MAKILNVCTTCTFVEFRPEDKPRTCRHCGAEYKSLEDIRKERKINFKDGPECWQEIDKI